MSENDKDKIIQIDRKTIIPEKLPVEKTNKDFVTVSIEAILPNGSIYTKTLQSPMAIYRALSAEELQNHIRETLIDPFVAGAKERLK